MTKYNFHVKATVTGFIQRECENDEEADIIKRELEGDYGFDISEFMNGVEVDVEDAEVKNYGESEE